MASGDFSRSRRAPAHPTAPPGLGALSLLLLLVVASGHVAYADGPYRGQVLEAETKQPIEGAAVLAVWWKRSPGPGEPIVSFYDAREVVTDSDGHFNVAGISGGSLNPLVRIDKPLFTIFKPGYEAYGNRRLPPPAKEGTARVELRRLTTRDEAIRNLDQLFVASDVPEARYPALIRLIDTERLRLGLRPTHPTRRTQP